MIDYLWHDYHGLTMESALRSASGTPDRILAVPRYPIVSHGWPAIPLYFTHTWSPLLKW